MAVADATAKAMRRRQMAFVCVGLAPTLAASALVPIGTAGNAMGMTLWQSIETLAAQMPLTAKAVEKALGVQWIEQRRDQHRLHWVGGGGLMADQVVLDKVDLVLAPNGQFDDTSGLSLELSGHCVRLDEVRARYGPLDIVQAPRGRSLQETTVHGTKRPWGTLGFAFQEAKPDCLFRVTLRGTAAVRASAAQAPQATDGTLRQNLQVKLTQADQHIQGAEFAAANTVLLMALNELGDRHVDPTAIDDTGMRLAAAVAQEQQGSLQTAVTIRRRILEARLLLWDRKLAAGMPQKAPS
jgi:hypothetical protein